MILRKVTLSLWLFSVLVASFGFLVINLAVISAHAGPKNPTAQEREAYARQVEIEDIQYKLAKNRARVKQVTDFQKQHPDLSPESPDFLKQACQCYPGFQSSCTQRDLDSARWTFPLPKSIEEVEGKKAAGLCSVLRRTNSPSGARIRPQCLEAAYLCEYLTDPKFLVFMEKAHEDLMDRLTALGVSSKDPTRTGESAESPAASAHAGQRKEIPVDSSKATVDEREQAKAVPAN